MVKLSVSVCMFSMALGRPQKLPDVCYSWWVLASLKMVGRLHWIDKVRL